MAVVVIVILTIFISTFFISVHADIAEAIMITFLQEEECKKRFEEDNVLNPYFDRHQLTVFDQISFRQSEIAQEMKKFKTGQL